VPGEICLPLSDLQEEGLRCHYLSSVESLGVILPAVCGVVVLTIDSTEGSESNPSLTADCYFSALDLIKLYEPFFV